MSATGLRHAGPQLSLLFPPDLPGSTAKDRADQAVTRPAYAAAVSHLAYEISQRLDDQAQLTWPVLFRLADEAFGGTQSAGAYSPRDAYDAVELAVVRHVIQATLVRTLNPVTFDARAQEVQRLEQLAATLPTQTKRSAEQVEFQQFSTPPAYALAAAYAAYPSEEDAVLEPSAGTGMLVAAAISAGARKILANELSPRRLDLLHHAAEAAQTATATVQVHHLDALYLHSLLPPDALASVVLMNPPFSSDGGGRKRRATCAAEHIEQALYRLAPGGRLVAIVGGGMDPSAARFAPWFTRLMQTHTLRANIHVSGSVYRKHGTTLETRTLVIDAAGPQRDRETITAEVESVAELVEVLEPVRATRRPATGKLPTTTGPLRLVTRPGRTRKPRCARPTPPPAARPTPHERPERISYTYAPSKAEAEELTACTFDPYHQTLLVEGSQPHPSPLVESAAMATVTLPEATYQPLIQRSLITEGRLSEAQIEAIIYAGQAHEHFLPGGERKGFFIGDGTGVGKGSEVAGIILDNVNQGRRKAVWITEKSQLLHDARRDWTWLGQPPTQIVRQNRFKDEITLTEGILFTTYATLRSEPLTSRADGTARPTRLEQIVAWLGEDFDGPIIFDESHNLQNVLGRQTERGTTEGSKTARTAEALQARLPKARVVYVSATGATEVANLAYARRLGLWGEGTPFSSASDFAAKVAAGGIAAMELVARDLKSMGLYVARSLSYVGVEYETLVHELTEEQRAIYDRLAEAWQIVLRNIHEALEITGGGKNGSAKGAAFSRFWSAHQRFFCGVLLSMKTPTAIKDIEAELEAGRSIVVQLVSTYAAATERAIARAQAARIELEDLDVTPRELLLEYVQAGFPTTQYETYLDENDKEQTRPLLDADDQPVENPEAARLRDKLLVDLARIKVPRPALDQLVDRFGPDAVAEITGRRRRFVAATDEETGRPVVRQQKINDSTRQADLDAFNQGRKRILIFSDKGGTGASYHADRRIPNQQRRVHYLLESGWRANKAVQGFGRTLRSNQATAPIYKLLCTDIKGERRFLSSIARRLDQLGALTRGQRDAQSQGIVSSDFNLENDLAAQALTNLLWDTIRGKAGIVTEALLASQMGLVIRDKDGNVSTEKFPSVPQFLNRILSLTTATQNEVFTEFAVRLDEATEYARQSGTLDRGMETLTALQIEKVAERTVFTHEATRATTRLVTLHATKETERLSWVEARRRIVDFGIGAFVGYFRQKVSGRVYMIFERGNHTEHNGRITTRFRRVGPETYDLFTGRTELYKYDELTQEEAQPLWETEYAAISPTYVQDVHLLTGCILPVWDRLGQSSATVYRTQTTGGERFLGRLIPMSELSTVLRRLGADGPRYNLSPADILDAVLGIDRTPVRIELSNGWKLRRARVSLEWRVELVGPGDEFIDPLREAGVILELIAWSPRLFIPTGSDGTAVLSRVLQGRQVVDVS